MKLGDYLLVALIGCLIVVLGIVLYRDNKWPFSHSVKNSVKTKSVSVNITVKKDSAHIIRSLRKKVDSLQFLLTSRPMPVSKEYFDSRMDSLLSKLGTVQPIVAPKKKVKRIRHRKSHDDCSCGIQ